MAQLLQNFADKLPDLAQRMVRGNAPVRVDVREHSALIEKSSTHPKSSRRISRKSESPTLRSGEVFPQTVRVRSTKVAADPIQPNTHRLRSNLAHIASRGFVL